MMARQRILILDDEQDILEIYQEILARLPSQPDIITIDNGGQAINLLVLITTTGGAQPIAAGIDYEDWPEVVGTIAGDDTVLMICPDADQAAKLKTRIEGYLG